MDWNECWQVGIVSISSAKEYHVYFTNIELIKILSTSSELHSIIDSTRNILTTNLKELNWYNGLKRVLKSWSSLDFVY